MNNIVIDQILDIAIICPVIITIEWILWTISKPTVGLVF